MAGLGPDDPCAVWAFAIFRSSRHSGVYAFSLLAFGLSDGLAQLPDLLQLALLIDQLTDGPDAVARAAGQRLRVWCEPASVRVPPDLRRRHKAEAQPVEELGDGLGTVPGLFRLLK
jgi:hypothetical protein